MRLHVQISGKPRLGELVLLHGWGMSSDVWSPWLVHLESAFRVHRLDLPGLGQSDAMANGGDLPQLAEALLEHAPERALWCGWSLGGVVAAQVAALAPQRVQALVTLASNPCFVARQDWSCGMPKTTFTQFQQSLERDWRKTLQRFVGLQVQGDPKAKQQLRYLRGLLTDEPPADLAGTLRLLAEDQRGLFAHLALLALPQWHLFGAEDALVPAGVANAMREIAELSPQARIEVLDGAAHLPFLSHPERVAEGVIALAESAGAVGR